MKRISPEEIDKWCENRFGKGYLFNTQLLIDFAKDLLDSCEKELSEEIGRLNKENKEKAREIFEEIEGIVIKRHRERYDVSINGI